MNQNKPTAIDKENKQLKRKHDRDQRKQNLIGQKIRTSCMSSRETFLTSPLAIVSPRSGPKTIRIVVAEDGSPRPTKSTRRLQLIMEERNTIRLKKKEIELEIARRNKRRLKALGAELGGEVALVSLAESEGLGLEIGIRQRESWNRREK